MGETAYVYNMSENPQGKRSLGKPRHRREIILKPSIEKQVIKI
jgi:hypothetical protein